MSDTAKHVVDYVSLGALVATILQWLPAATAGLIFVWTVMRMVQTWQELKLNHRKLSKRDD